MGIQDGNDDNYNFAVNEVQMMFTITNDDNELPNLVINEFQIPTYASSGDAGLEMVVLILNSQDEFIEIYNASGGVLDISDYTITPPA